MHSLWQLYGNVMLCHVVRIPLNRYVCSENYVGYSGFEVTCPNCDLKSALDHAARDRVQISNRNRYK